MTGDRDDERVRVHVHVSGRVQGVTYRATTRDEARSRGVDGWVRNLADGRVEAVFEGPSGAIDAMLDYCHEGPRRARVEDVTVAYEPPESLAGFEIRR
jgi:acylphosphatase